MPSASTTVWATCSGAMEPAPISICRPWAGSGEHRSAHALRTQRLHGDPAVGIGDPQPLGEGQGGMLGHRVRRRCRAWSAARRRRRSPRDRPRPAASQPGSSARAAWTCDKHVDPPAPPARRRFQRARHGATPALRAEQVDAAEGGGAVFDQGRHRPHRRHRRRRSRPPTRSATAATGAGIAGRSAAGARRRRPTRSAIAAPMPEPAPVITTRAPSRSMPRPDAAQDPSSTHHVHDDPAGGPARAKLDQPVDGPVQRQHLRTP